MKKIQNRKIKTHQGQMTCEVKNTMVNSKALSNPPTPQEIHLRVAQTFYKNQFSSEKNILM